jgi:hypothetical protein
MGDVPNTYRPGQLGVEPAHTADRIETNDIDRFHTELELKGYEYALPGIDKMPWGTRDMTVKDPVGNKLTFANAIST